MVRSVGEDQGMVPLLPPARVVNLTIRAHGWVNKVSMSSAAIEARCGGVASVEGNVKERAVGV